MKTGKKENFKLRSYKLTLGVMELVNSLPRSRAYNSLGDQLFRSASSIGANVIEAKSASSKKDFINFYQIALKSANETKYWLALVRDLDCADTELAKKLLKEVTEIANILGASILTLKGKRSKGKNIFKI